MPVHKLSTVVATQFKLLYAELALSATMRPNFSASRKRNSLLCKGLGLCQLPGLKQRHQLFDGLRIGCG